MNQIKFKSYQKEFPFLESILSGYDPIDCYSIEIKRIDKELLAYTPKYCGATGSLVGIDNNEVFFFVKDDGEIIKEDAVKQEGYCHHNEAHWDNESRDGETVIEALARVDTEKIAFIVKLHYGYVIQDHRSQSNFHVVIYKSPKGFTIQNVIADAEKEALAQVKAEAEF